ncbi:PKD-like domain-containing protein [Hymenobacter sp. B81]|uniref:PKD-like domain-containing protein n=1 Tax=Hymenobacter sp. B81 TaxID=3344878 RepID=UPI0037DD9AEC
MRTPVLRHLLLLLALLSLPLSRAMATHLMGGEMTYRYLDANGPAAAPFRYELLVTIYTDEAGVDPRFVADVGIYNKSLGGAKIFMTAVNGPIAGGMFGPGNLAIPRISSVLITPPTPGGCSVPGGNVNVFLNKYRATINLPVSFDGYYAVFTDNARNNDVNNIANAGGTNMTLYTDIAPPLIPNQSPQFSDTAVAVICQGDTSIVLNNAFDADGDRLIYSFGTPSGGGIPNGSFAPPPTPVTYAPTYSLAQPFGPGAGSYAALNASTGLSMYSAPTIGKFVVAVDVREYRNINGNEVLVGVTRRDVQLVSRVCNPNQAPKFTAGTLAQRSFTLEEGQTVSFTLASTDADGNPINLKATSVLLDGAGGFNATFGGQPGTVPVGGGIGSTTLNGPAGSVSGQFRFTARCGDGRATPYDVAVTATDVTCGAKSVAEVFQIFVTKAPAPTGIVGDTTVCDLAGARSYTATGPAPSGGYNWRVSGGTIQGPATGNSIQVLWGSSGQGRVTLRNVSAFDCLSDSVSKNITIRPAIPLVVSPAVSICPGQSTTLTASGGTTYTWTGGPQPLSGASITVSPTQTTTYTVTSGDGVCSVSRQVTVTVNAAVAQAGADRALCSDASVQLGAAALPGYTYQWSPAANLSSATAAQPTFSLTLAPGSPPQTITYTLTATSPQGCTATDQVTVTLNAAAVAQAGVDRVLCSGLTAQLGAAPVAGLSYQWSPATGLSSATVAQPTFNLTNPGTTAQTFTYTVTATTAEGCTSTDQVTVTLNPAAVSNAGANRALCSGLTSQLGTAALPGYTYQWLPATGLSDATAAQPTFNLTTGGTPQTFTYSLVATNAQGCSATSTVQVTVNPAAIAQAGADRLFCSGASAQLGGSPQAGHSYQWSPATGISDATAPQPTVTLTNSGTTPLVQTYTLTTTTAEGCTATDQVTVTVNPAAVAQAGIDRALCSGQSVQLGSAALTGYTYQWSPAANLSSATSAQPTFSLTNPGTTPQTFTYTVTATTAEGCTNTDQVTVTLNPVAVANAGTDRTLCSGTTAQLGTAALTGYSYQWSPATGLSDASAAQPTFSLTNPGTTAQTFTYTVTATTAEGCTSTDQVTVTLNPAAVANAGLDRTLCSGASAQLGSAALTGYTYQWSPATGLSSTSAAQPTVTLTNTGTAAQTITYTVTATTAEGCVGTDQVVVVVNPVAVANAGTDRTLCSGTTAQLGSAALTGYTYQWSPATGLSDASAAQPTFNLTNPGTTAQTFTYTVTATTAEGCTNTDQVTVTLNPAAVANAGADVAFCSGASAQIGSAALPGYTYQWLPATDLNNPTAAQPTVSLVNTGRVPMTIAYNVFVTTPEGCTSADQVEVTINPVAIAQAGADRTLCSGETAQLGSIALAGYTYQWAPATGLSDATAAEPTFSLTNTGTTAQTFTYTVTVTTPEGCTNTDQVTITLNPAAVANAGADVALCSERSTVIGTPALPGSTYQWTAAQGLSNPTAAQPTVTVLNPGATPLIVPYYLTVTNTQGCVARDTVLVTFNPRPALDSIQGSASVCPQVTGVAYSIRNPRATAYQWRVTGGNIVSGQGTPAITVDWLGASSTAKVEAFQLNGFLCSSDTVVFPVQINQILATEKPRGALSVCQQDGTQTYSTQYTNGSIYAWEIIGGTQVSTSQASVTVRWTTPGTGKIVVTETSQPAGGTVRCLGTSDTLYVTVRPTPTLLAIAGPARVCTGNPVSFSLPGAPGSTYQWLLNGGPVTGTSTLTLPGLAAGAYTLTVRETNAQGCQGPEASLPFVVDPTPAAVAISGPASVCSDVATGLNNVPFSVPATTGSTYQWTVTGGTLTAGAGTNSVEVSFTPGAAVRTVSVVETSAAGCPGPAATFTVALDASSVALNTASVDLADDRRIGLAVAVPNNAGTGNQLIIKRRVAGTGAFTQVGTAPNTATSYTDATADADATAYDYRVELTNACGRVLSSTEHTTMRVAVQAQQPGGGRQEGTVKLAWNAYQGFGVARYEVYRQLPGGQPELLTTVPATAATSYTTDLTTARAGFNQAFRIKAVGTDAQLVAWSNATDAQFENKLAFYNIITPNGDNLNDTFWIDNVELYPGNTLTILNRWGREVYKTSNYRNTWNAADQSAGTYYFLFKQANGTVTRGAFEVVK